MTAPLQGSEDKEPNGSLNGGAGAVRPSTFYEFTGEYVAADVSVGQRSWTVRGQNFCVVLSWLSAHESLHEDAVPDEHAILVLDGVVIMVEAGSAGQALVEGPALVVVPPGNAEIVAHRPGYVLRLFTARVGTVLARALNGADYETTDSAVIPLPAVPREIGPGTLRVHSIADIPDDPNRFGRIFRTDSLMLNWFAPQLGPRDTDRLSPHMHEDFEQASVTLAGDYVHHLRRPWTPKLRDWRPDEHVACSSPSVTLIPPGNIHTTRAVGDGQHILVDVFAPPRTDFVVNGWVLNQGDYAAPTVVDRCSAPANLLAGVAPRPAELPVFDGILHADLLPDVAKWELSAALRNHRDPYVGVTTDGVVEDVYRLADTGVSSKPAVDAARGFLAILEDHQRIVAKLPLDSPDWRLWTNAFPVWTPKGIRLDRVSVAQREAALAVIEASLSPDGFRLVRDAMRLNGALGDLIDMYRDTLTEFTYYFTMFGEPRFDEPWGWQLMGHHIDVHCVFVGSQLVLAPVFVGAEPTFAVQGRYVGTRVLDAETQRGLDLRRALGADQEEAFLLGKSLLAADLPAELAGPFNGRHLAGAGRDNLVLPFEGIRGDHLTADQQRLLFELMDAYINRMPAPHAALKRRQVQDHLDKTYFAWRGKSGDTSAFYYRVHSPVLLIEYDNHPGIFLDNDEPERFHVHTIMREPNGNDYGKSLLAQHYALHHP